LEIESASRTSKVRRCLGRIDTSVLKRFAQEEGVDLPHGAERSVIIDTLVDQMPGKLSDLTRENPTRLEMESLARALSLEIKDTTDGLKLEVEKDITKKAEDCVNEIQWLEKWYRMIGALFVFVVAVFGFFGIKSFKDTTDIYDKASMNLANAKTEYAKAGASAKRHKEELTRLSRTVDKQEDFLLKWSRRVIHNTMLNFSTSLPEKEDLEPIKIVEELVEYLHSTVSERKDKQDPDRTRILEIMKELCKNLLGLENVTEADYGEKVKPINDSIRHWDSMGSLLYLDLKSEIGYDFVDRVRAYRFCVLAVLHLDLFKAGGDGKSNEAYLNRAEEYLEQAKKTFIDERSKKHRLAKTYSESGKVCFYRYFLVRNFSDDSSLAEQQRLLDSGREQIEKALSLARTLREQSVYLNNKANYVLEDARRCLNEKVMEAMKKNVDYENAGRLADEALNLVNSALYLPGCHCVAYMTKSEILCFNLEMRRKKGEDTSKWPETMARERRKIFSLIKRGVGLGYKFPIKDGRVETLLEGYNCYDILKYLYSEDEKNLFKKDLANAAGLIYQKPRDERR
jgi:hypothetical protein